MSLFWKLLLGTKHFQACFPGFKIGFRLKFCFWRIISYERCQPCINICTEAFPNEMTIWWFYMRQQDEPLVTSMWEEILWKLFSNSEKLVSFFVGRITKLFPNMCKTIFKTVFTNNINRKNIVDKKKEKVNLKSLQTIFYEILLCKKSFIKSSAQEKTLFWKAFKMCKYFLFFKILFSKIWNVF